MEVGFPDGAVYQYYDVSQTEYSAFLGSPSLGSALSRYLLNYSCGIISLQAPARAEY